MLENLPQLREGHTKRISSWDKSGGNADRISVEPKATQVLAKMEGAGTIRHIWVTVNCEDDFYLRKVVLRMYWDGFKNPSVEVPLGDFFGIGHGRVGSYNSLAMNMSARVGQDQHAAMNCYFPMPFGSGARIEVENQCDVPITWLYYYIDYDELDTLPRHSALFHAQWRSASPCPRPVFPDQNPEINLSDKDNYVILEAKGRGHYVGCNLSVHNLYGGWWGEGDDMFMIDGDKWPPDLHGTGSEDYFTHAWGMQPHNAFLYSGVSYHIPGSVNHFNERVTVYRHHLSDPVIFHRSLKFSIEHGHANDRCDDYSSTAYWYQTLPHAPFPILPPPSERLPRTDITVLPADLPLSPTDRQPSGSPIDPRLLRQ